MNYINKSNKITISLRCFVQAQQTQANNTALSAPCVSFEKREYVTTEGETVKLIADIVSEPKPTVVWENKSKRDVAKSKSRFTYVFKLN